MAKKQKPSPIYLHITPQTEAHDCGPSAECFCEPIHIDRIEANTRPVILVIHREDLIRATLVAEDIPPHTIDHASTLKHKSRTPPPEWDGYYGVL